MLGENGLRELYPEPFLTYHSRIHLEEHNRARDYDTEVEKIEARVQGVQPKLERFMFCRIQQLYNKAYP
jgi:hypothetical protein